MPPVITAVSSSTASDLMKTAWIVSTSAALKYKSSQSEKESRGERESLSSAHILSRSQQVLEK